MGAQLEWRTVADVPVWLRTICVRKGLVTTVLVYKQTHCSTCPLGLAHVQKGKSSHLMECQFQGRAKAIVRTQEWNFGL